MRKFIKGFDRHLVLGHKGFWALMFLLSLVFYVAAAQVASAHTGLLPSLWRHFFWAFGTLAARNVWVTENDERLNEVNANIATLATLIEIENIKEEVGNDNS